MKYEVLKSVCWVHVPSGNTASIYGAVPWTRDSEKKNWQHLDQGWTVRNPYNGTVGVGRIPWKTKEEAQAFADSNTPPRISMGD